MPQIANVTTEPFKEDPREFFLGDAQHRRLAALLNRRFDIPLALSEEQEFRVLMKMVRSIDRNLMRYVPSEILDRVNDRTLQVEAVVAQSMKDNFVPVLVDLIPLPFLPTILKRRMLEFVVDLVVDAIAGLTTLDDMIEGFLAEA